MGRLFKRQVRIFVHPWLEPDSNALRTVQNLDVPDDAALLYRYLVDRRRIVNIEAYDPELLSIRSDDVRALICTGGDWEHMVQPEAIELIKRGGFFGCPWIPNRRRDHHTP
jgi:hypothetical protein